jgi:methionyl-tRNA formyltransferase
VTLAPEPDGDRLRVDWTWPVARVLGRIRALSPVPGLAIEIRGVRIFVTKARLASAFPRALHASEAARTGEGLVIRAGDAAIVVERAVRADEEEETIRELSGEALAVDLGIEIAGI